MLLKTIGIVLVACFAARAAGGEGVRITSTLSRTSSPARAGSRSNLLSADRYSIAMFLPSTQPQCMELAPNYLGPAA